MQAQPTAAGPSGAISPGIQPQPFEGLEAVESQHASLVKELKTLFESPAGIDRVRQFLARAAATGARLDVREDRASVQGLMNFWIAKLASASRAEHGGVKNSDLARPRFEETLLAEFDPETIGKASSDADRWLLTLSPPEESVARCVLLRLARLGADGQTFEPVSTTKAALYDLLDSSESVDRAVSGLAKTGVIHVTRGENPDAERITLRSKDLLTSWETYKKWLDDRRAFREMAAKWEREGRPKSRLLRWEELEEPRTYQNRSKAEQKFVEECRYEDRRCNEQNRFWMIVFGILAFTALAGMTVSVGLYLLQADTDRRLKDKVTELGIETRIAKLATGIAKAEKAKAETARAKLEESNKSLSAVADAYREANKQLGKDYEREGADLGLMAKKEQDIARQVQTRTQSSRIEDRPVVSIKLARDPYLKGQWRLWKNGAVLAVRFLEPTGDEHLKELVKKYASEWTEFANLKFDFESQPADAPIRLTFNQPGSWAAVGTSALTMAGDQPTINLGLIRSSSDEKDAARIIRHEFGHVLGLIHEQANPNANIRWNRQAVLQYYGGPPSYWSPSVIQETIFDVARKFEDPEYRAFDPKSIMMFPVPAGLAEGLIAEWNMELSEGDKKFVAELYPR